MPPVGNRASLLPELSEFGAAKGERDREAPWRDEERRRKKKEEGKERKKKETQITGKIDACILG
jgi:hypothetical protein